MARAACPSICALLFYAHSTLHHVSIHRAYSALQVSLRPGFGRRDLRGAARAFLPANRRRDEALGRRVHQVDQDDHRPDHFLYRGGRHCRHGGHEKGRQDRWLGAAVLRDRVHTGLGHRFGGGEPVAAGCRHACGRCCLGHQEHCGLHGARQDAGHGRLPAQCDSQLGD